MLESYYFTKIKSRFAYSLQLLVYALIVHTVILYVPMIVQMMEQHMEEQANSLVAYRVVANSTYKEDEQQKQQIIEATHFPNNNEWQSVLKTIQTPYQLNSGKQLLPPKWVNNRFYPQNHYAVHAVVLGNGRGNNWFCAMFQKVCIQEKKRVKFSIWQWLKK